MHGDLPLRIRVDGHQVETHSSYTYAAGGTVLVLSTVLPDHGLAVELISTYVGHTETGTIATHLLLGPEGHPPTIHTDSYDREALHPVEDARSCAYDHARQLIDVLTSAGHHAGAELDEHTFAALERIE